MHHSTLSWFTATIKIVFCNNVAFIVRHLVMCWCENVTVNLQLYCRFQHRRYLQAFQFDLYITFHIHHWVFRTWFIFIIMKSEEKKRISRNPKRYHFVFYCISNDTNMCRFDYEQTLQLFCVSWNSVASLTQIHCSKTFTEELMQHNWTSRDQPVELFVVLLINSCSPDV